MNILVTGGAGYIGSHTCLELLSAGHDVIVFHVLDEAETTFPFRGLVDLQAGLGAERLGLHGGNTPYDPPEYYHFRNGRMYNGLTVVAWNLADTGPEQGGFCCIPGSHKVNYPCPPEIRNAHLDSGCVVVPEAGAGSVVIFTEALTHGTAPWRAEHQRRSLLYKYSPAQQSWHKTHLAAPEGVELTQRQQLLFEPPYFSGRVSLFEPAE